MNRDTIVGIVGALVLVAAMVAVFAYERNVAVTNGLGGAAAPVANATIPGLSGTVALGKSDVKYANVTGGAGNLTFHLTWTATNGRDTLKIIVAPPAVSGIGEGAVSEPSDSGDITVTVKIPPGADPAGLWKVTTEFVSAAPAPLPGGVPPPATPPNGTDANVAYAVAVSAK